MNGFPQQQLPFGAPQQQPQFGAPPGAPQGVPPGWQPPQPGQPQQQQPQQPQQPQVWNPQNAPSAMPQWQPQQSVPQQWQQPAPQPQQPQSPQQWSPQGQQPQPGYPQQQPQYQQQPYGGDPFMADPFAGLDNAEPNQQRGEFFEEGKYHLRIKRVLLVPSRKSSKTLYTIETEVITSNNPNFPPGKLATGMVDMSNKDMRDRNMMTFLAAVMGFNPSDFQKGQTPPNGGTWAQLAHQSLAAHQPLKGIEIGLVATTRPLRNDPNSEFTDLGWMPKALVDVGPVLAARQPANQQQAPQNYGSPGPAPQNYGSPQGSFGFGPPPGAAFGQMPQGAPGFGMQAPQNAPQGAPQGQPLQQMPQGMPMGAPAPQFGNPAPAPMGYPPQQQQPAQQQPQQAPMGWR